MGYIFLYKKVDAFRGIDAKIPEAKPRNKLNHFDAILMFLDEMNLDLVFEEFEKLRLSEEQWISNLGSEEFNTQEFMRCINKLGKR